MKLRYKTTTLPAICVFVLIIVCFSCNKDGNPNSKTIIKCVTCANGGICTNGTCICPIGYEGVSCETLSIDKFLGSWNVSEQGTLTAFRNYTVEIVNNSLTSFGNTVQIQDLYDTFPEFVITSYVIVDSLFIPSQQISGKTFIGKGYIHSNPSFGQNGTITMRYAVTNNTTGAVDDFGYYSSATSASNWVR